MYATGCLGAETSIPALLNGEHSVLYRTRTINNLMPGLCVLPDPKRTRRMAGYLSWLFPRCKISPKLNVRHHTSGMKCSRWYFLFAT